MKKILFLLSAIVLTFSSNNFAQMRPAETAPKTKAVAVQNAPAEVEAKYEGGMFGYSKKEKGKLKFDDANERLVFFGKDGKEHFAIPYKAVLVVYPNSRKVQSGTGRAVSAVPILGAGIAGSFIRKKKNYLIIQFRDPDAEVQGVTNFLLDTDELLASVVQSIGTKANLTQRGDAFYRPTAEQK